jgi:hypothetical protein
MSDYITASRTKDHFEVQLLQDYPEIVSIAPQLKLDDQGHPTDQGIIVIGVAPRNALRSGPGESIIRPAQPIPSKLPAVDPQGKFIANDEVTVIVEYTGSIDPDMNTARMRPCPGGFSIGHTRSGSGTFGGNVRFGANFGYILSNNHVLAALNTGVAGDPIVQPGVADGGTAPMDTIATLTRFVPLDLTGGNNEVDCAIAQANNPADILRHVQSIGTPTALANATVKQAIRKSGRTTQLTNGTITSDNATARVTYGTQVGIFVNQLKYSRMCDGGDSGSLIWDQDSLTVVGLHFSHDTSSCYGNKILRVLELLSQAFTVYDPKGMPTHFPKTDISLLDLPQSQLGQSPRKARGRLRKSR